MIITRTDLLNSGKYFECKRCNRLFKWKHVHYNPLDKDRTEPKCRRCINAQGSFKQFDKADKIVRKKSHFYDFLFKKYLREGLTPKQAFSRIKAIKSSNKFAHKYNQENTSKTSFKEEFTKLTEVKNV